MQAGADKCRSVQLIVQLKLQDCLEVLPTVKNAQDENLLGIHGKGNHGSFAIVRDTQTWANIVPLVPSVRERP